MVNNRRGQKAEPAGNGVVATAPEAAARRLATGQLPGALVLVTGAGSGTKAAVLALSLCLRADWSPVGVSIICPGVIDTPILSSSRFLGSRGEAQVRARAERVFRRGHAPEVVAEAIIDAVRRDRAVVPVGWEARLGWWGHRLTSVAAQQRIARWGLV
jgi:short-subunit dehydrogenase